MSDFQNGWKEVSRVPVKNGDEVTVRVICKCGREVILFTNGGEMDMDVCRCGRRHELVVESVSLIMSEPDTGKPLL